MKTQQFTEGFEVGSDLYNEVAFFQAWPDGSECRRCVAADVAALHEERRELAPGALAKVIRDLATGKRTPYRQGEVAGFLKAWLADIDTASQVAQVA